MEFFGVRLLIVNSAREWGGTEKWAVLTARGLAALGHKVYFGCRDALFEEKLRGGGVTVVRFALRNNADLLTAAHLKRFAQRNSIDAILPSKQREYFLAGCSRFPARKPLLAFMFAIDRPIANVRNHIAFCHFADRVIVVSKRIVEVLGSTRGFDTGKCRIVYQGVETRAPGAGARTRMRSALGVAGGEALLLGIGRLTAQKGFDIAIHALAELVKVRPNVKLCLVGGFGDRAQLENLACQCGVADRVLFAGFQADVGPYLDAADVYWLSSRSEGIPNAMLEAMAAHLPVVSFAIAGVPEVITDNRNGLLATFGDTEGFVKQTIRLLDDPALRQRIGDAGFETVKSEFSVEKMCRDTEAILEEALRTELRRPRAAG